MTTARKPRRFRRYIVKMPATEENSALLEELQARSGWRITGRFREQAGHLVLTVKIPKSAVQHHSRPELRNRDWELSPAPKTPVKARKRRRRWPRPIPPSATVFGTPANARQCPACQEWHPNQLYWDQSSRSLRPHCPRCAFQRRAR
jgi:hypothetical protein